MHIALISHEYPPDTAVGGIATYVKQAAAMLAGRGHKVEVFCASGTRKGTTEYGLLVSSRSPEKVAAAAIALLQDPARRMALGAAARQRVLENYSLESVGAAQEQSYRRAIARRQAAGPR